MFGRIQWTFILMAVFYTISVEADYPPPERLTGMNPCINKKICTDCIRTPHCAWCAMPDFSEKRCFLPNVNTHIYATCQKDYVVNPDNEYVMVRHASLTKGSHGSSNGSFYTDGIFFEETHKFSHKEQKKEQKIEIKKEQRKEQKKEAVQMWPQEVNLKLRVNEPYRIHFSYARAEDYPVDLYYLMDLSKSMDDDKQKLSDLGKLLVESMQKITSDFRLGFGSFVDKVVMPYVSIVPKKLIEPCGNCTAPYGYKHIMRLSKDTSHFTELVRRATVSGNLDAPEGGFDAIMQAIVCRDDIGWREKARRLLVFSTDDSFHYAGDGKLGGIVKPNDGLCHLDKTGLYTHSSLQDYPSISQINLKVKENAINIIWAVTEKQLWIYKKLTEQIEGSFAGKLDIDSSNIVELIREQYDAISSSVEMKDTASSDIKIRYFTKGLADGPEMETSKCDGLKVGTKVDFVAEIEITSCPVSPSDWKQTFNIYPVGINESLIVNLEMLCACDCDRSNTEYSPKCNNVGYLTCGTCLCDPNYFGNSCECSAHHEGTDSNLDAKWCRPDNTSLVDCSGRGICSCGVCECDERQNEHERITGRFCECDNFSCDREKGVLCSGHGICECGQCVCDSEWTGPSCNCRASKSTCIPNGSTNGVVCSGHGDCVCGECVCHVGDVRYSGKFCNKCPTCPSRCEELIPCVQCQVYHTGNYTEEECLKNCQDFTPETVDVITVDVDNDEVCYGIDEDDCKFTFVYYYVETNVLKVRAQAQRECPPQVFMLGIVLGVIAAIVLIGLALLFAWKAWIVVHDRREFVKFEQERMMAKWDTGENPIYKQATSTFKNPMYTAKS